MPVNTLFVKLRLQNAQFRRGLKQSSRDLDKFAGAATRGTAGLGARFGAAGIAYGAQRLAAATWELGELGAQTIQVRQAFEELNIEAGSSVYEFVTAGLDVFDGAYSDDAFPQCLEFAKRHVCLPLHNGMSDKDAERVSLALANAVDK